MVVVAHTWETNSGGEPDQFAYDIEAEGQGHNGPRCTTCKLSFCTHCDPGAWQIECPGPAPEGDEWDWIGDGAGHPPRRPGLWSEV